MKCPKCQGTRLQEAVFALEGHAYYICSDCLYFTGSVLEWLNRGVNESSDMNVEVTEFYETSDEDGVMSGRMDIILTNIGITLRGIHVTKCHGDWYFHLPYDSFTYDHGISLIRYPVFSFIDVTKTEQLKAMIREKGVEYIEKKSGYRGGV